jgi:hypothetical protein
MADEAIRKRLPPGITPRLLTRDQAAAYCGVGKELFEQSVDVPPLRCFGARVLWDRRALDRWLDQKSGLLVEEASRGLSVSERLNGKR